MIDLEKIKTAALAAKGALSFEQEYEQFDELVSPEAVLELIERLEAAKRQWGKLQGALDLMLERIAEPPEPDCSCHLSPPCNDCVEFGGEREAFEVAKAAMKESK